MNTNIDKLNTLGLDFIRTEDAVCLDSNIASHADVLLGLINSGDKLKVPVIITPTMAKEFLERNSDNIRSLNKRRVKEELAPDVSSGNWVKLNALIAFDVSGRLKNGQHTCAAIVKGDRDIVAWVQTGITREQEMVMDNCSPRAVHCSIEGMNLKSQGVLKAVLEYGVKGQHDTSNRALSEYWNRFSASINKVMAIRVEWPGKPDNAVFHASLVVAMESGVSGSDIGGFVKEMFGPESKWIQASHFRNTLNQNHYRGYTAKTKKRQFSLALMVLENYLAGNEDELPRVDAVDKFQPLDHWAVAV